MSTDDLLALPDLAVRTFGGSVVWANDELFAGRENLVNPGPAAYSPHTFGAKGQVYDGWETRRRRDKDSATGDQAIVRLGTPGVVRAVVVDTSHFTGNFPSEASVEALRADGHPSVDDLRAATWTPLVERSPLQGDTANTFPVNDAHRWTHVRLTIYPDGGVARLRVHGEVVADPSVVEALGTVDLAALDLGGIVARCSNRFYGSPDRLIAPGLARSMGEGWETARRRDDGNDWVEVRLAARGVVRVAELDTTWFLGNAPGEAMLSSYDGIGDPAEGISWTPLLPRTALRPDTRHRFLLDAAAPATHVRLDVYPDGGMARLRLWGAPTDDGLAPAARPLGGHRAVSDGARLGPDTFAEVDALLADADERLAAGWPGDPGTRQPVHTLYVPADRAGPDVLSRLAAEALDTVTAHALDAATMADVVGLPLGLVEQVWPRVLAKLRREPVEDLRLDLEDGYGRRDDAEEDGHATRCGCAARTAGGRDRRAVRLRRPGQVAGVADQAPRHPVARPGARCPRRGRRCAGRLRRHAAEGDLGRAGRGDAAGVRAAGDRARSAVGLAALRDPGRDAAGDPGCRRHRTGRARWCTPQPVAAPGCTTGRTTTARRSVSRRPTSRWSTLSPTTPSR